MVIIVNKLAQLPLQAAQLADVIVTREGVVLKNRYDANSDPRRVKRALRLLGVKEH
jgi:hypothetical protein